MSGEVRKVGIEGVASGEVTLPRSTRIRLMRHGQAAHNVPGKHGFLKDPKLTDIGYAQSIAAGESFKGGLWLSRGTVSTAAGESIKESLQFSRVIVSTATRTRQTAEGVRSGMKSDIPITQNAEFRERNNGCFAVDLGDLSEETSQRLNARLKGLSSDKERWNFLPTDVAGVRLDRYETEEQSATRYLEALFDIAKNYPGEDVLVVGHAMGMASLLARLKQQMREQLQEELGEQAMHEIYSHTASESVFTGNDPKNTAFVDLEIYYDKQGERHIRVADLQLDVVHQPTSI